ATIADNVGDNVGDTAGMGADIFESYAGSIIATMFIGSTLQFAEGAVALPLIVASIGLLASVLAILTMSALKNSDPAMALRVTPIVGIVGLFLGSYFVVNAMEFTQFPYAMGPFYAMVI